MNLEKRLKSLEQRIADLEAKVAAPKAPKRKAKKEVNKDE